MGVQQRKMKIYDNDSAINQSKTPILTTEQVEIGGRRSSEFNK